MTSSRPLPPYTSIPHDGSINGNANPNSHNDNDDDAQSDISVPYSSLTESTTTTSGNGFLTPTSSDARTVAAEGVNLQTISSVLHEMESSEHHDGRIDDFLAQWRSLYHDEIERQIIENRNRDRERSNTITNTLSARNLQLHTSQTSETLAGEVGGEGGASLHDNAQTKRREKGERSKSSPSDSSSTSSGSSSYMKYLFNPNFTIHHLSLVVVLLLAFLVAYLRLPFQSLSALTTDSASASNISHDDQDQLPPLTVLTPAPTEAASCTRSSTPTATYESAPTSPSSTRSQKSKPRRPPSPSSRYTRHADPQPNQSFILLEASTGRALTLIDGNLRLVHVPDPDLISLTNQKGADPYLFPNSRAKQPCIVKGQCNWHWHCVENAGWLGFRNAASGTFLGHDMWQNIIARVYKHQGWEFMTVRPALERKGWYLMVTHWEKLHKINYLEGPGVFEAKNPMEGTVWEFVRV